MRDAKTIAILKVWLVTPKGTEEIQFASGCPIIIPRKGEYVYSTKWFATCVVKEISYNFDFYRHDIEITIDCEKEGKEDG